jgi:formylglycine-generating enzyme required for sulfatase activity
VLSKLKRSIPDGNKPREVYVSTMGMRRDLVTCGEYAPFLTFLRGTPGFDIELEKTDYVPPRGKPYKRRRYVTVNGHRLYDLFTTGACVVFDEKTETFSAKPGLERRPLEAESYFGAALYCASEHAQLPTEAQFARVRQQAGTLYPFGPATPSCQDVAYGQWADDLVTPVQHGECESLDTRLKGARDVGSSIVDVVPGLGIHDLGGNVRQWTRDGFIEQLSACEGRVCIDPVAPPQPDGRRAVVGGAYSLGRWFMFATTRGQYLESRMDATNGFRCVK